MCEDKKKSGASGGKWLHIFSLIFRAAGIVLAAAAAGAMLTASQCTVTVYDADYVARPHTITYSDFPAFVYLVAATAIATLLEAVALFVSWSKKRQGKKAWRVLLLLLGAVVPALLYTAAGAAFAVGWDVSYYLEPIGRRFSVCHSSVGDRFCEHVHVSMWLALGAAAAVSVAEFLTMFRWYHGGGSDSDSESSSDSESVCGHGCHCKH